MAENKPPEKTEEQRIDDCLSGEHDVVLYDELPLDLRDLVDQLERRPAR